MSDYLDPPLEAEPEPEPEKPPFDDDPGTNVHNLDTPLAHGLSGACFGLCCLMVLASIATFFKYQAYKNLSSMTLIGLQVLMWISTGIVWGLTFFHP